jgi:hypothetical protein
MTGFLNTTCISVVDTFLYFCVIRVVLPPGGILTSSFSHWWFPVLRTVNVPVSGLTGEWNVSMGRWVTYSSVAQQPFWGVT